jgi:hypothetical protein
MCQSTVWVVLPTDGTDIRIVTDTLVYLFIFIQTCLYDLGLSGVTTVWPYEFMTSLQFATFYTRCLQTTPPLSILFFWPCISVHPCNENQIYALFILSLFRQSTSTCFGHICSPSSGGILYIYNNWYVLYIYIYCIFCLMARIFHLMLVLLYIYIYIYI